MKELGYYNGKFGPLDEMTVPMNDRVCYFGDGVYEATTAHNRVIHLIDEHVNRFFNSASMLEMKPDFTKEEMKETLYRMLEQVEGNHLMVYWQLTRGTAPRGHAFPDESVKPNLWIMIKPIKNPDLKQKIAITEAEDTRFFHCNIKTLNLIPSVMAAQKAVKEGCYETVFHRGEIVTECAHSNISILKDGVFITHPLDQYVLPGIARSQLILACKDLGIAVDEREFTMKELLDADEIIVSSSTRIFSHVESFQGKPIGGKDQTNVDRIRDWVENQYDTYCAAK